MKPKTTDNARTSRTSRAKHGSRNWKPKIHRISFQEAHLAAGAEVILRTSYVVFRGDDTYVVPEETIRALKRRRVPFTELEFGNGSLPAV